MDAKVDPAQAIELAAMRNQEAMNDVIDRFDSPIQKFYSDSTLFITGASGFLGKQLVEKLLRSCKIKRIYVLLRPKKGKSIQRRLETILKDPVYDGIRHKQPDFINKIVPMEGDIKEKILGMSEHDRRTIMEEVEIIIHMAATVRFDEPIKLATLLNVRGTIEALALAKKCSKLKNFVYVSTAYSQATYSRNKKDVLEQFYPCPMPPAALVQMAEEMEEERLNDITPSLTKDWPNTYTFTKALAEEAVRTMGADLPICIIRPSIVLCSYREPLPGWMDMSTMFGPSGVVLGASMGVLHVFKADSRKRLSFVPVDFVNNAVMAAGWDSTQIKKEGAEIPIYSVASIDACLTWKFVCDTLTNVRYRMCSMKALWFCYIIYTRHASLFWILSWLLHLLPAYIIDGADYFLELKPKNMPPLVSIYDKINKFAAIFDHFLSNEWLFRNTNTVAMMNRMSDADKAIYNCDVSSMDGTTFLELWSLGVRKYLMKDELKNTLKAGQRQRMFMYANFVIMVLYICGLVYIVYSFLSIFARLFY